MIEITKISIILGASSIQFVDADVKIGESHREIKRKYQNKINRYDNETKEKFRTLLQV